MVSNRGMNISSTDLYSNKINPLQSNQLPPQKKILRQLRDRYEVEMISSVKFILRACLRPLPS